MIEKLKDIIGISKLIFRNRLSIGDGSGIIKEFEDNFKKYTGVNYALATNNGTSALHSAYFALGLKKGDEVIVPSYTWHSTVAPLLNFGVKPIFAEINPNTLTLDSKDVERKITKKTKLIVVVHLFGNVCDMDDFFRLKQKYNINLLEDCSHSFGAFYRDKKVGSLGDVACFSLQSSKSVSGGEAGILVTNNKEIYEKALIFGHAGRLKEFDNNNLIKYSYTGLGFKYRPHAFAIVLANNSLKSLDKRNKKSLKEYKLLNNYFSKFPEVKLISVLPNVKLGSVYGYRVIYNGDLSKKKDFIEMLNKKNIIASDENFLLLHKQPLFKTKVKIPVTEEIHKRIIKIKI